MEDLKVWRVKRGAAAAPSAEAIVELRNTETERLLEDLLASSPELLEPNLTIIARQFQTENGPLDLMAVDSGGRLVIAELKRGALTRDAVAQVIDYVSWVAACNPERLAADIALKSGSRGVERFEDIDAWYSEEFGASFKAALPSPRVMLVGVGIDDTARRMVKYLGSFGLDVSVVTFHAYEINGETYLARSVEIDAAETAPTNASSELSARSANEMSLSALVAKAAVGTLFDDVREVVGAAVRSHNKGSPKKSGVTFYLPCWIEKPPGGHKSYVKVEPDEDGRLVIVLMDRARREGGPAVDALLTRLSAKKVPTTHGYDEHEITVDATTWPTVRDQLVPVLNAVADGIEKAGEESSPE